MTGKYYWIKERHNPQLGVYYKLYGRGLTVKEAKSMGSSLYGFNYMLKYKTEAEYNNAIEKLKARGERVS